MFEFLRRKVAKPRICVTPAAMKVAVLLCGNSPPCEKHTNQAVEFWDIFMSGLPWSNLTDIQSIWGEIDGFCEAKASGDLDVASSHMLRINQIIEGIAASAWSKGNQAGKRVAGAIPVVDMGEPIKA